MENYNHMKIKKSKLFDEDKDFLHEVFSIRQRIQSACGDLNNPDESEIDLDYMNFQFKEIQTHLTRAKKMLASLNKETKK